MPLQKMRRFATASMLAVAASAAYHSPLALGMHAARRCTHVFASSARVQEAQDVCTWVAQRGGSTDSVTPAEVTGCGVSVLASRPVRRGDVLVSVPLELGLSAETVLRSSIGVYLAEFEPYLGDYAFLALALLHERRLGEQSELAPWLSAEQLMPAEAFDDLPLVWGSDGIAELEAATTAGAGSRLAAVLADYEWLSSNAFEEAPVMFPTSVFSLEAYTAAVAIAISRAVVVTDAEGVATPMLLPLLDLPNHEDARPAATVQLRTPKAGLFGGAAPACAALVATEDLSAEAPVTVRYGGDTAGQLFLDHGVFVEPVAAVASVAFALETTDRLYWEKLDVLEAAGLGADATWLLSEDEEPPLELLSFLRLKQLSGADAFLLEPVFFDALWSQHLPLPVSEENEAAALGEAAASCQAGLAQLGGSVQEDLQVLAEAPKAERAYKLAALRYAERRALQSAARWFDAQLGGLKSLEYYQERRLSSLGLNPVETEEELDSLRAAPSDRAAGRRIEQDYEW